MSKSNQGYSTPAFTGEIDLQLSRNESACALPDLAGQMERLDREFVSCYPSHQALQDLIGKWIDVDAARIVVTAGGDDSIDRVMRVLISPERNRVVTHAPSFEMVDIYAGNYGGQLGQVDWMETAFPVDQLMAEIDTRTALVVLTTPNNPTGKTIPLDQILDISRAARGAGARLLVDLAYVEFADNDPTAELAGDSNVMMVRTFSKAWGLAGLRVGYLIAPNAEFATTIRNAAGPFPVSAVSLEIARQSLLNGQARMQQNVRRISRIRSLLQDLLQSCGGRAIESEGNFVLAGFDDADAIWNGLAKVGIGVRKFSPATDSLLQGHLRITCPWSPVDYFRLTNALCQLTDTDAAPHLVALEMAFQEDRTNREPTPQPEPLSAIPSAAAGDRTHHLSRVTRETSIELTVNLDGCGRVQVATGIGFLDHMLTALAFHSGMDLSLTCQGDLEVDDHHTAEDCALALGSAIDAALGPRTGIQRFGFAYAPLDEALARTVIDLSGRPWPEIHLGLQREAVGTWACENITHFFQSLAMTLKCSLHVDVLRGTNDHHRAEAAFKSLAKALRTALARTTGGVPSTKGVL